jgi:tRNA threonylcarbamoyl adenosine modification protein YeaZ
VNQKNNYLLAIESAIAGGSIALLDDSGVIAARCGHGSVSRAEDLLPNIVAMLDEAGVSKNELARVAVSLGPGSYTGLRIGISTAMGLKRGLNIEYVGVPLFEALSEVNPDTLIAVPMGKTDICFVDSNAPETSRVVRADEFTEIVRTSGTSRILVHPALTARLPIVENIEFLDPNLASYIGRAAFSHPPSEKLEPIYVQNPRFG